MKLIEGPVKLIVVAAPSGAGKSSFVDRITSEDKRLHDVITYTTRPMRHHEEQGRPYYFISKEEFEAKQKENFFIESAKVHTNFYGTSFEEMEKAWGQGKVAIMDIDIQGVKTYKSKYPEYTKTVFILPPSIDELRRRVLKRDGKAPDDIEIRMANAEKEMAMAKEFDLQIVNDQFDESYANFKKNIEIWLSKR